MEGVCSFHVIQQLWDGMRPGRPLFLPAILSLLGSLTCVAQILIDTTNKNLESDIGRELKDQRSSAARPLERFHLYEVFRLKRA